jgi:hypothetical protein
MNEDLLTLHISLIGQLPCWALLRPKDESIKQNKGTSPLRQLKVILVFCSHPVQRHYVYEKGPSTGLSMISICAQGRGNMSKIREGPVLRSFSYLKQSWDFFTF